jgi:hypothetical protein
LLDRTATDQETSAQAYATPETSDRQASMMRGVGPEATSISQEAANPLLMSLRLHMALAASSRLEQRDDRRREDDRQTPETKDSVQA